MVPATTIIFAIQSAIKLSRQARLAYVDATRRRELILPLPDFKPSGGITVAIDFFMDNPNLADKPSRLDALIVKLNANQQLEKSEEAELVLFHTEFLAKALEQRGLVDPKNPGSELNKGLSHLIAVRQWTRETDPHPTALQRLSGTFVEIGVDYFLTIPGGLNLDSKEGRALHALFQGLDKIDFKTEELGKLPRALFFATMDVVAKQPELVSADPKIQRLITGTTTALSVNVALRIQQIDGDDDLKDDVVKWGELVFRSVLEGAGRLVAADPKAYLGVAAGGESAVVGNVGNAILDLLLDSQATVDEGNRTLVINFGALFSKGGLDKVVDGALAAVAKHPELIAGDQQGLRNMVTAIANDLGALDTVFDKSVFADATQMVLKYGAANLELLWPDAAGDPERTPILKSARKTLEILSAAPAPGAQWRLEFGREDLLAVLETALAEVAANPGWLLEEANAVDKHLGAVLTDVLAVLRAQQCGALLSKATGVAILKISIKNAALRAEFTEELSNGKTLTAAAVDAVLSALFDPAADRTAKWRLLRAEVVEAMVSEALDALAKSKLGNDQAAFDAAAAKIGPVVRQQLTDVANGDPWHPDAFGKQLIAALS